MTLKNTRYPYFVISAILMLSFVSGLSAQPPRADDNREDVRVMTIPISIFTKEELKKGRFEEFVQAGRLTVLENKEEQEILSIKSVSNQPLALAVLMQDDLSAEINLQLDDLKEFIAQLPEGSRVLVAYLRGGSLQIRQPFTRDLDAAAKSLRVIAGSPGSAPRSPYESLRSALNRFDGLPNGRRAVLMVSDGLDVSGGIANSSPGLNGELDRAVLEAQKRGVAVYSIYSAATYTNGGNSRLVLNGQSSLERLSEQTGGRAFFQGFSSPISFKPFLANLDRVLTRQFALTYLSTHMKSGYYKVVVESSNPEVRIDHPQGYYYRRIKNP